MKAETIPSITIVLPERSEDALSEWLRAITRQLSKTGVGIPLGLFGGEFGYGADFENDVFLMRPDYQDDECNCGIEQRADAESGRNDSHSKDCYQSFYGKVKAKDLCKQMGIPWNDGWGSAMHCTCGLRNRIESWFNANSHADRCPVVLPNFWHKRTGLKVTWYKYIGRENEIVDGKGMDLDAIMEECLASISPILGIQ